MANLAAHSTPSSPAEPTVISLETRRRLHRLYEQAMHEFETSPSASAKIHQLLAECVRQDPGNLVYVDALLRHARRLLAERSSRRNWLLGWFRDGSLRRAVETRRWAEVWRLGIGALETHPDDAHVLCCLATAAQAHGFDEVEQRYLRAAVEFGPDDLEVRRQFAATLTRQGDFDDAGQQWREVLRRRADHDEANKMLRLLEETPSPNATTAENTDPNDTPSSRSEQVENQPILAKLATKLAIAERLDREFPGSVAVDLMARLRRELNQQEVAAFHQLADRFPNESRWKRELAVRLKRAGNYAAALSTFQAVVGEDALTAELATEIGECLQFLRRFPAALNSFQAAIAASVASDPFWTLARYRAAVLATGLGELERARQWLEELVAIAPDFKDASARLDKLREIRDKR